MSTASGTKAGTRKARPPAKPKPVEAADREQPGEIVDDTPKLGRPPAYKPEYATQAEKLCKLGATVRDLADFFEVSETTIYNWRHQYPTFLEASNVGKGPADDRVVQSLYRRATGYSYDSEKLYMHEGRIIRARTVEHVPPSDTAAIFWLKNRRKDEWKDVRQLGSDPDKPLPGAAESDVVVARLAERLRALKLTGEGAPPATDGSDLI